MRLKALLSVGIVVVCLALFVFGKDALSYLAGARQYTGAAVKNRIPAEFEISRLKTMLTRLDGTIEDRREALIDMQLRAEALEREITGRRRALAVDRTALQKALVLLENGRQSYVISGETYSYAEVDADARIKSDRSRQDAELLDARENTLKQFNMSINDSLKIFSDAEVERQRLANSVQGLEIRVNSLTIMQQMRAGREYGTDVSLGKAYTGIEKAISDLEKRLAKQERLLDIRKTGVNGIDYAKNEVQSSGLEAIREVLR